MRMREDLAAAVRRAQHLASINNLWPEWDLTDTPLVLHSPDIAYTVGHPSPPEAYKEAEPVAGRRVHTGPTLPEMAANTVRTIAGSNCALVMFSSTPLKDIDNFARLILHECFHAYQSTGLSRVALPDYNVMQRYPESDPENNAGSIVENRILCSALKAGSLDGIASKSTYDVRGYALRFIAVRQARHKQLEAKGLSDVCLYEQQSEFNEGTPTYVEVKAGKPVSEVIAALEKSNIAGKWAASRRFYVTGAAIALLLDTLMPGWHKRLSEGAHTMQSLLAEVIGPPIPDATQVLKEEGYERVLASEHASSTERKTRIDSMFDELTSGPGVRVEIEVPEGVFTLFDPINVIIVRPGERLHTTVSGLRGSHDISVDITRLCLEDSKARRLTMRLPAEPEIRTGNTSTLSGPGLKISAPQGLEARLDPDGTYRVRFK